jgi:hypothetical protein
MRAIGIAVVTAMIAVAAPATAVGASQVGQARSVYLDNATVRVTLRAVVDPLPAPDYSDDRLHSRPSTVGRYVAVKLTVSNRGPGRLRPLQIGVEMIDTAKREARQALLIGWPHDEPQDALWDGLSAHVVRDGWRIFEVRSGRRPARLVLTAGFG